MKLIIDIDEDVYKLFTGNGQGMKVVKFNLENTLKNGIPLEEKTGHWIKYGRLRCGEQHYQCTSCGYYINFGQWGELYTKEFKYCPNCGAKMEENKQCQNKKQ
jgi:transposase-like protein